MALTGREMRSTISEGGKLTLSLETVTIGTPDADEVIIRIEAAPINPSDLGMLLGPADVSTAEAGGPAGGAADRPTLAFTVPQKRLASVRARLGQSLPIGNEGAGTVIAAGRNAKALEGKRVAMIGGAMYADYRKIGMGEVVVLPEGASAADGASMFVNPLTALGFVETARAQGHKAIIHTAAASNLGQMLLRICLADDIALINIVRSGEQVELLRSLGARYVLNSKDADFLPRLTDAIAQTGATIAFDAIGGGTLASDIMQAMESAAAQAMSGYNRYGSQTVKQLYIYGALDLGPTTLNRMAFGFQWSVSGWLLFPFLNKAGPAVAARLRQRVLDELTTTFASSYTRVIGLAEALRPDVLQAYLRKATGEKFLIDPRLG